MEQTTLGLIAPDESDTSNILAIDATVLRTCRQMYAETLPILYGDNTFFFNTVYALNTFRKEGLATTQCESLISCPGLWLIDILGKKFRYSVTPTFNLEANPNGRLSMIKKLWLDLALESPGQPGYSTNGAASCTRTSMMTVIQTASGGFLCLRS